MSLAGQIAIIVLQMVILLAIRRLRRELRSSAWKLMHEELSRGKRAGDGGQP